MRRPSVRRAGVVTGRSSKIAGIDLLGHHHPHFHHRDLVRHSFARGIPFRRAEAMAGVMARHLEFPCGRSNHPGKTSFKSGLSGISMSTSITGRNAAPSSPVMLVRSPEGKPTMGESRSHWVNRPNSHAAAMVEIRDKSCLSSGYREGRVQSKTPLIRAGIQTIRPQHCLNFLPEPQAQAEFRPGVPADETALRSGR
jgi:hypothetical protein